MAEYFLWDDDFHLNASRGKVRGANVIHKFGAVPSMAVNTTGTIWDIDDTPYPWSSFTTAGTITALQSVGGDDGKVITVQGLDGDYNEVSEDFTLSSSGDVAGSVSFIRVFRAFIKENGANVGDITFQKSSVNIARIKAGKGQTLMAVYTVPATKTAYLSQIAVSAESGSDATIDLYVKEGGTDTFRIKASFEVVGSGGPYINHFTYPLKITEKSDIDFRATTRSNNGRYTATFDLLCLIEPVNVTVN